MRAGTLTWSSFATGTTHCPSVGGPRSFLARRNHERVPPYESCFLCLATFSFERDIAGGLCVSLWRANGEGVTVTSVQ